MHRPDRPHPPARHVRWPLAPLAAAMAVVVAATPGYAHAPDTEPPTRPGPIAVADVTSSSVILSWAPSTDNTCVAAYLITVVLGDVVSRKQSRTNGITLTGLAPSNTYHFRVVAGDAVGNLSAPSDFVSVTLPPREGDPESGIPTSSTARTRL